ncbi:ClpP/crotonase-like domain-containing protein [Zychaea mexicana]|uniref:ClpP/crotonase-like domain-containing protein n=1 Tax=Zychaea mexicana TaxID=64656 RepID=UPI0022FE220A|nr:ClpP/crotonase-like domain-containing protein [Zychaea mexicana]KAI9495206.1 ClpP/crotonase-like domain-containing protein [Zychaea mexicana]
MSVPKFETLEITLFPSGVCEMAFNRPHILNALSAQTYQDWLNFVKWAAAADSVKVVVFIGRGRFYSAGQELAKPDFSPQGVAKNSERREVVKGLVHELIKFPKLLIAAVNGGAYGFGVTTLALCDVVYCVPSATFTTPFMKLGFAAEGCSSYLFPKIMGHSRANEMLLMGRTFSAQEAIESGFVSRSYPEEGFRETVLGLAEDAAKFSADALAVTKKLTRDAERDLLHRVNEEEMARLTERNASKESIETVMRFAEEAERKREEKRKAKEQKSKL